MKLSTSLLFLVFAAASMAASAQSHNIQPPLPPVQVHYEFWQNQYVQWIGDDLPYSMVELDTGATSGKPLYLVTFTDRSSGKRISFTNAVNPQSQNATLTEMRFTPPDPDGVGGTAELALVGPDRKPVFWRFVQAVDLTQQGGGLLDMHQIPFPFLYYREEGALSGEGTALQVGNTVSPAALWSEVSRPPYFTAYHAARSSGIHIATLNESQGAWKVSGYPTSLDAGAEWKVSDPQNNSCTVHVDSVKGNSVSAELRCESDPDKQIAIEAERSGDGWLIQRTSYSSRTTAKAHSFSLAFAPGFPEAGAVSSAQIRVIAEITGRGKIAEGDLIRSDADYKMTFTSPSWLKDKPVTLSVIYAPRTANLANNTTHETMGVVEK